MGHLPTFGAETFFPNILDFAFGSGSFRVVMGKSLDSAEKGNVDKMSEKSPEGLKTQFSDKFLDNFCLFGQGFCLVTLSNARPIQR